MLAFTVTLYWFAGIGPIISNLRKSNPLSYLNSSGVTFVGIVLVMAAIVLTQSTRAPDPIGATAG